MKVLILVAVLAVVSARSPSMDPAVYPTYDAPAPVYATPAPQPAQPYTYEWEVKDAESYNDYSHSESSDGKVTTGSYRVLLPDGRIQVVTYKSDAYGYTAEVKYIGEPQFPDFVDSIYRPSTHSVTATRPYTATNTRTATNTFIRPTYTAPVMQTSPPIGNPVNIVNPVHKTLVVQPNY